MWMVLPELNARLRTGLCGESGLHFIFLDLCRFGNLGRGRKAIPAPIKLGIRPRVPGKGAALFFRKALQIFSLISFFIHEKCFKEFITQSPYLLISSKFREFSSDHPAHTGECLPK